MNKNCGFDSDTKEYLRIFRCILDTMILDMTRAELTDSISHNFIVQMIPHHRAAIEMSKNILKYTNDKPLQNIASQIITEQTKSIEDMREIERRCANFTNSQRDLCLYQGRINHIMKTMFSNMRSACTSNRVNCDFMWEMIPHHRGAVEMSANTLMFNICSELVPILQAIISSQKRGIEQMQNLLECLNC